MSDEMRPSGNFSGDFEATITRALERRREAAVPAEFAARVVTHLPARRAVRQEMGAGRSAGIAGAVVLAIALVAIAPHAEPNFASVTFDLELLLLAQLAAIAYWLGVERTGFRG
jgi:hypothetical protein